MQENVQFEISGSLVASMKTVFGMLRRVVSQKQADVSEVPTFLHHHHQTID
jgi:hypothetical protein